MAKIITIEIRDEKTGKVDVRLSGFIATPIVTFDDVMKECMKLISKISLWLE